MSKKGQKKDKYPILTEEDVEKFHKYDDVYSHSEDEKDNEVDQTTGAHKSKHPVAKAVASIITAGAVCVGGYFAVKTAINFSDSVELVHEYSDNSEGRVCCIPSKFQTDAIHDEEICDGNMLVASLKLQKIKYCELLDEYYTEDGRTLVEVTANVSYTESKKSNIVKIGGKEYITPLDGYELDGKVSVKKVSKKVTKILEKNSTGDYSSAFGSGEATLIDGEYYANDFNAEIIETREIETKKYDEIKGTKLTAYVEDVSNGNVREDEYQNTAVLKLQ